MSNLATFVTGNLALKEDENVRFPDPALRPSHGGYLTPAEQMEIARAVMRKNRTVLAELAK